MKTQLGMTLRRFTVALIAVAAACTSASSDDEEGVDGGAHSVSDAGPAMDVGDSAPDTETGSQADVSAEAGCVCDPMNATYGSDSSKTECLCQELKLMKCLPTYESAVAASPSKCAEGWTVVLRGEGQTCGDQLALEFSYICLESTTLFFDRGTHALSGAQFGIDGPGAPCGTGMTRAGNTTWPTGPGCTACRLCGTSECVTDPPCFQDAGAD